MDFLKKSELRFLLRYVMIMISLFFSPSSFKCIKYLCRSWCCLLISSSPSRHIIRLPFLTPCGWIYLGDSPHRRVVSSMYCFRTRVFDCLDITQVTPGSILWWRWAMFEQCLLHTCRPSPSRRHEAEPPT